ncbi:hypothetical protein LHJ74_13265 [Streptomyces sp. N2-109]|uniref:Integral membrane protein n=1 Tax=Streptomyces gossypii TaxID=2883101 RepID=A0ABT2JSK4_9ACTN|nr:hypothetical protein [Streptomyces gossypii]MCT2590867.1 hypothetical protein [Streptomyces gossypii]
MASDIEADRPAPTSLEIAARWAELPADHLKAALRALEPQLAREHHYRLARLEQQEADARRAHRLGLAGLASGFLIAVSMLTGAVLVGLGGQPWLAAMLSGPSVLALATLFVLRRTDPTQTLAMARTHRAALSASTPPPAAPPTEPGLA